MDLRFVKVIGRERVYSKSVFERLVKVCEGLAVFHFPFILGGLLTASQDSLL
jgi:hypothetical protein